MDTIRRFLDERILPSEGSRVRKSIVTAAYRAYCVSIGEEPMKPIDFGRALGRFHPRHIKSDETNKYYLDIVCK
jgi:hypothetical protein